MNLNNLDLVNRVQAPQILFDGIEQKILLKKQKKANNRMAVTFCFSIIFILFLNAAVLFNFKFNQKPNLVKNYAESMRLFSNTYLYK